MSFDSWARHLNHKRIDKMRTFKLKLAYFLFSPFNKFSEPTKTPLNILVLRMDDKLGDGVSATGFLRELKQQNHNCQLTVVAGASTERLYQALDFVDEVHVSKKGIICNIRLFLKLRRFNFYYIINTSHILNPRVIFLVSFLKAFKKISFENKKFKIFSEHLSINFKTEHITDRYRNLLKLINEDKSLDVQSLDLSYQVAIDEKDLYTADQYIKELRKNYKYVVAMNSFAGGKLRNFSKKITTEIVVKILKNPEICILSVANSGDHEILKLWREPNPPTSWVCNSELSSLSQNMALVSLCDLVVTPDTAWVHIACALKKKLVAIYREDTDPNEKNSVIWAPYKTLFKVVFATNNKSSPEDINNVDSDKIVMAVNNLLLN